MKKRIRSAWEPASVPVSKALQAMEREHKNVEKGLNRVNPLLVPMMISNMAVGNGQCIGGLKSKSHQRGNCLLCDRYELYR